MNNALLERVARVIRDALALGKPTSTVATEVLAELAGELRDAGRYRWMRTAKEWDWPIVVLGYGDYEVAQGEGLDKAIDEARGE